MTGTPPEPPPARSARTPSRLPERPVLLRSLCAGDEAQFVSLAGASVSLHEKWIRAPRDADAFQRFLARFGDVDDDDVKALCFVVCAGDPTSIVGFVSLTAIEREPYHRGRLGYGVFAPFAGRGYLSEGLRQVVSHAFGELQLHRLEADIQPENVASRKLVIALGFRCEGLSPGLIRVNGTWTDHERWAITADQWPERPRQDVLPEAGLPG